MVRSWPLRRPVVVTELTAIVLAEDAPAGPAIRLAASAEELRQKQGGIQLVHETLKHTRDKLQHTLGPDRFAGVLAGQARPARGSLLEAIRLLRDVGGQAWVADSITELGVGRALAPDDALHCALKELEALESPEDIFTSRTAP